MKNISVFRSYTNVTKLVFMFVKKERTVSWDRLTHMQQ